MVRRLVITGLPCPAASWEEFLGKHPSQTIITMSEVFRNCSGSDPRDLSQYITREIERLKPNSIVCHNIGVPLTLLSLLRLKRHTDSYPEKLTIFNGAFRGASLWRANHPMRVQVTPMWKLVGEIHRSGGAVDPALWEYVPRIRSMYRLVIMYRLTEKLTSLLGLEDFARNLS